jgi:predicted permease
MRSSRNDHPPGTALLRVVAHLVPSSRRDDWLAEWRAELLHAWSRDHSTTGSIALRLRCLGAIADAVWLWRRYGRLSPGGPHMITHDLRFATRSLLRKPAFTSIVVGTLAVCIGATTSVFSIVESVLLNGLAYQRLDRLVAVWQNNPKEKTDAYPVSVGDYFDLRQRNHSFSRLAGFFPLWDAMYGTPDGVERVDVGAVSANFLATLGVAPRLGRGFIEGEDRPGAPGTVVLTHSFWIRAFQGDPAVIGRSVTLDDRPYTVIGVMDEGFTFPENRVDVLMPLAVLGTYFDRREVHMLSVVGRLRDGVTIDVARREMVALAEQFAREHPKEDAGLGATVRPLADDLLGTVRRPILVLFGAVCAVLLIGCANVTNLLLARAWSRRQELAVRSAMGAQPGAIARHLLVESGVVALLSSALGVGLAFATTRAMSGMLPASISRIGHVQINGPVLGFTLAVSIIVTLVCGAAPALDGARTSVRRATGERLSHGRGARRLYRALVVGELSLALVLTVSAGLLINSFVRLAGTDTGFRRDHLLRAKISLPEQSYSRARARNQFYKDLLDQIRALPGIRSAGIINRFPLRDGNITTSVIVDGQPRPAPGKAPSADLRHAGHDYFKTMGIPFAAGRDFNVSDGDSTAIPAVIVNQTAAKTILGTSNPVGRRISLGAYGGPLITIVGVVGDVHDASLRATPRPQIFLAAEQTAPSVASVAVDYDGAAAPVVAAIRRIARSLDRTVPLFDVQTIDQVVDKASVEDRFTMLLLSGFSALALMLAALGTYGVMGFGVSERTREIGVRMALGARTQDVLAMILREGMILFGIAIPIALGGVWATTRTLRALLFGVGATDPTTVSLAMLTLAIATSVACYVPARRAARVDPTTAIRGVDAL